MISESDLQKVFYGLHSFVSLCSSNKLIGCDFLGRHEQVSTSSRQANTANQRSNTIKTWFGEPI